MMDYFIDIRDESGLRVEVHRETQELIANWNRRLSLLEEIPIRDCSGIISIHDFGVIAAIRATVIAAAPEERRVRRLGTIDPLSCAGTTTLFMEAVDIIGLPWQSGSWLPRRAALASPTRTGLLEASVA